MVPAMALTGTWVPTVAGIRAFVPDQLPPRLDLAPVQLLLDEAAHLLGELSGAGRRLVNPHLVVRPLVNREAVATSRMEGTITSLDELFRSQVEPRLQRYETREVLNYVTAFESALEDLKQLPICSRLIKNAHRRLLAGLPIDRAGGGSPGEFKRYQNHIGHPGEPVERARFVPCPPSQVERLMNELEEFINSDKARAMPPLIEAALVHYQFETIHPFPDGNGRLGRLLIPLLLISRGRLNAPLLYPSPQIEARRTEYVDHLLAVSLSGEWTAWIRFFLEVVRDACREAIDLIGRLESLRADYLGRLQEARSSALLARVVDHLFVAPIVSVPSVQELNAVTYRAAQGHVKRLIERRMLVPLRGSAQPMLFVAREIIELLNEGHATVAPAKETVVGAQPELPL